MHVVKWICVIEPNERTLLEKVAKHAFRHVLIEQRSNFVELFLHVDVSDDGVGNIDGPLALILGVLLLNEESLVFIAVVAVVVVVALIHDFESRWQCILLKLHLYLVLFH